MIVSAPMSLTGLAVALLVAVAAGLEWTSSHEPALVVLRTLSVSLALLVAPLAAGAALGRALRGRRPPLSPALAALAAFVLAPAGAAACAALLAVARVGVWDGALVGALLGLALALGLGGVERRRNELLLALGATLLSLGLGEAVVRRRPEPPTLPPLEAVRLTLPRFNRERVHFEGAVSFAQMLDACTYLFPDAYPASFAERSRRDPAPRDAVLHLGDSMTFGLFLQRAEAFPAVLERATPGVAQVNGALPGMSLDYHLLIARRWLDRLPARLVVVHLFDNDVHEMGEAIPCCNDGPLLDYRPDGPAERCRNPAWPAGFGESVGWIARNSLAPYPLRAASSASWVARWANVSFLSRVSPIRYDHDADPERKWRHFALVLRALRAEGARRGVPVAAVLLPLRAALESPDPRATEAWATSRRMATLAASMGITVLDPWADLGALVRRDGAARYFIGSNDIHFSVEGHRAMAAWLAAHLTIPGAAGAGRP